MKKVEKGEFGYLAYKKRRNMIKTIIAFAIVLVIFIIGFIIWKSKNNYLTMLAVVLVLPAAKFAVSYFVLIPHRNCDEELKSAIEERKGELNSVYDLVVSNKQKPVGIMEVQHLQPARSQPSEGGRRAFHHRGLQRLLGDAFVGAQGHRHPFSHASLARGQGDVALAQQGEICLVPHVSRLRCSGRKPLHAAARRVARACAPPAARGLQGLRGGVFFGGEISGVKELREISFSEELKELRELRS